ncbi:MAG: hypothetical protein AB1815_13940 [Bacillota bacterium]
MPLIMNKKQFYKGLVSLILFLLLLIPLFTPVFEGKTGMEAADNLFNSLSKGSSYYIPMVAEEAADYQGKTLDMKFKVKEPADTELMTKLFAGAGAEVAVSGEGLAVKGDLGAVIQAAIADSDDLFLEQESAIQARYGEENARLVLYCWYDSFYQMEKHFMHDNRFDDALFVKKVMSRALEPSYNFAGFTAAKVSDRAGITIFLLTFYVFYTLWYGFSIMFLFEGLGITASKSEKKET